MHVDANAVRHLPHRGQGISFLKLRSGTSQYNLIPQLYINCLIAVKINLYPFKGTILKPGVTLEDAIENIDIGGPTMLRPAAKNHKDVVVICDPADYETVIDELKKNKTVSYDTKYRLALKVFQHTAAYDAMISDYLRKQIGAELPDNLTMTFEKVEDMRYGETPHQKAAFYREIGKKKGSLVDAKQLNGKSLSFNNINDTNGAL